MAGDVAVAAAGGPVDETVAEGMACDTSLEAATASGVVEADIFSVLESSVFVPFLEVKWRALLSLALAYFCLVGCSRILCQIQLWTC